MPSGFIKKRLLGVSMADFSEFSDIETAAFDGIDCDEGYPDKCLVLYFMATQGLVTNKPLAEEILAHKLSDLIGTEESLSNESKNTSSAWEIQCKRCGLSRKGDILDTNNKTFDKDSGTASPDNLTLSKSGSKRRREEARKQMEDVADAFGFDARMIREATRLFNVFHENGSSSGGRGHKVTAVAALRVASLNAGIPVPVAKLCMAHIEKPNKKIVKRFINSARSSNLFNVNRLEASEFLSLLSSKIEVSPEILMEAKRLASLHLPGMRADEQACASLFLAAGDPRKRAQQYSGAAISRVAMIDRKRIYSAISRLRRHETPLVLSNPVEESRQVPSTVIKELRRIRRG
jgi:hypothetical protein